MSVLVAVLWAVLLVLLAALGLVLLVLGLPLHLRVRGAVHDDGASGAVRVAWAFGLVSGELTPAGLAVRVAGARVYRARFRDLLRKRSRGAKPERKERRAKPEDDRKETGGRGKVRGAWRHRGALLHVVRRLGGTLHLRLRVRGTVGLDDPADTARLSSVLAAIAALPGVDLAVELDWLDETLEGEAVGSARLWLPETAVVAITLLFERRSRAAVRALAG
jgi:hypothetical protein